MGRAWAEALQRKRSMGLRTFINRQLTKRAIRVPTFLLKRNVRYMRQVARTVGKGDVVIDLGAHLGVASIEFALRGAEVHAFEPHPEIFAALRESVKEYPNIHIYNKAASDVEGPIRLYYRKKKNGMMYEGSTIISGKTDLDYHDFFDIDGINFSDFIYSIENKIKIVKVDVEGMEYRLIESVLNSGAIGKVEKFHIECHASKVEGLPKEKDRVLNIIDRFNMRDRFDFNWP
jgi:FkbM family methyltransferase